MKPAAIHRQFKLGINAINAQKSCINRSVRRDKAKRIYE